MYQLFPVTSIMRSITMERLAGLLFKRDIFDVVFILLEFIGERLHYTSPSLILYRLANIYVLSFVLILVSVPLFRQSENRNYIASLEAVTTVFHILLKYLLFLYHKSNMEKLYEESLKIRWKDESFDTNFLKIERNVLSLTSAVQLLVPFGAYVIVIYMLKPLISGNVFLLETWMSDSLVLNTIVLAFEYYVFLLIIPIVVSYDFIYLALCVHIIIKLRRLNYRLQYISKYYCGDRIIWKEMVKLIQYHEALLIIFRKLRRMFSITLLFHYFVSLFSSCAQLYMIMVQSHMDTKIITLIILYYEFAYYVFPAQQISTELSNISTSIYLSDWHGRSLTLQKLILFIMRRSQLDEYFTGENVIVINADTFGSVIRKSFSFYAILANILNSK